MATHLGVPCMICNMPWNNPRAKGGKEQNAYSVSLISAPTRRIEIPAWDRKILHVDLTWNNRRMQILAVVHDDLDQALRHL